MNNNLLIIGAGCCGLSAKEIAEAMGIFEKIGFLDDNISRIPGEVKILGTVNELENFVSEYSNIFVAITNPEIKLNLMKRIRETTSYRIVSLVSPRAYISPTAKISEGTIIEAMAVVNTESVIAQGCVIGAGSIVNHCSMCCEGVHLECGAVVADRTVVPAGTKIDSDEVFKRNTIEANDLFFDSERIHCNSKFPQKPHPPISINGMEYSFEDGM